MVTAIEMVKHMHKIYNWAIAHCHRNLEFIADCVEDNIGIEV